MTISTPVNVVYSEVRTDSYLRWEATRNDTYKRYRDAWNNYPRERVLGKFPLHLDLESTNRCNLLCPMCHRTIALKEQRSEFSQENLGYMDMSLYKKILDEVAADPDDRVFSLKLSVRGEPLLHPGLVDMVRYAKEKGIVDIALNTNAVLLSPELGEQILDAGVDRLLISFDAPDKETYEKIRIGANFEKTLDNIRVFRQLRDEKKSFGTQVRVGMVLTREGIDRIDAFKKLFWNVADVLSFNKESIKSELRSDTTAFSPMFETDVDLARIPFACSFLWQRMVINWNGTAKTCCENFHNQYIVGDANIDTIQDMWHGMKYRRIRELNECGKWWEVDECKICPLPIIADIPAN